MDTLAGESRRESEPASRQYCETTAQSCDDTAGATSVHDPVTLPSGTQHFSNVKQQNLSQCVRGLLKTSNLSDVKNKPCDTSRAHTLKARLVQNYTTNTAAHSYGLA